MASTTDHTDTVPLIDYVKARLDNQDGVLETIARDVRGIHKQTKETNGRVTELEKDTAVSKALFLQKRWAVGLGASGAFILLGGVIGTFFHQPF